MKPFAQHQYDEYFQVFDKDGIFKYMFGNQGKAEGCLWYPRKVAVLRHNGNFVVCDRGGERSRMQIFNSYGHFRYIHTTHFNAVLKSHESNWTNAWYLFRCSHAISIRFIDIVAGLAINHEGHIVAVDSVTPTIFVLSEGGDLVRFHECSDFMKEPSDIGIFERNYYVCDFKVWFRYEKNYSHFKCRQSRCSCRWRVADLIREKRPRWVRWSVESDRWCSSNFCVKSATSERIWISVLFLLRHFRASCVKDNWKNCL